MADAIETLEAAVAEKQLPDLDAAIVKELAREPDGVPFGDARLALQTTVTAEETDVYMAISRLQEANLLRLDDRSGVLSVDFGELGLDTPTQQAILLPRDAYENLGPPLSPLAIGRLGELFHSADPIYVTVEASAPHVFPQLLERAKTAHATIIIFPRRAELSAARHEAYDRALRSWVQYISSGQPFVRKYTRVVVARDAVSHLFLSILAKDRVRFTFFTFERGVRYGQLVEAKRGTSLYETIERDVREAMFNARPLWRLWKRERMIEGARRWLGIVVGAAVAGALALTGDDLVLFVSALIGSVVANAAYDKLRERHWTPPDLFRE